MAITAADIVTADTSGPLRLFAYSVEGWGKTTFGSEFPAPIYIAPEDGYPRDLRVAPKQFKGISKWTDVLDAVDFLIDEQHSFETLVIDTLDWIEPLVWDFVCQRDSGRKTEMNKGGHKLEVIEDYGYGKGYAVAADEFRILVNRLIELREKRGLHVVVLAHAMVKNFKNPEGEDYDRWEPKVHGKSARLFVEWSDAFLFGRYEVESGKIGEEKRAKGVSTGKRMFMCRHSATHDAKNRFGMPEAVEVTLDGAPALIDMLLASAAPAEPAAPAPSKTPQRARQDAFEEENRRTAERDDKAAKWREEREARRERGTRGESESSMMDPGGTYAAKAGAADAQREERADTAAGETPPARGRGSRKSGPASNESTAPAPSLSETRVAFLKRTIMEKVDSPLVDQKYQDTVARWVQQAGDDERKLDAVMNHVVNTLSPQK